MPKLRHKHLPPHIYLDDTWYCITASTLHHAPLFADDTIKTVIRDTLKNLIPKFSIQLRAWVILDNHYHILLKTQDGQSIPRFLQNFHGYTARQINKQAMTPGCRIWYNYWDTCIRSELAWWIRFNYIHCNPVKHGYVPEPSAWNFSSYHYYLRTKGEEWVLEYLARYPVNIRAEEDDI